MSSFFFTGCIFVLSQPSHISSDQHNIFSVRHICLWLQYNRHYFIVPHHLGEILLSQASFHYNLSETIHVPLFRNKQKIATSSSCIWNVPLEEVIGLSLTPVIRAWSSFQRNMVFQSHHQTLQHTSQHNLNHPSTTHWT